MKNVKQGHSRPIVCLDAGHYGKYNAGVITGYYESEMNWKLTNKLKAELETYGIEVRLTREKQEKDLGLRSRGRASQGADLFISIHSNGVSNKPDVDYPVAFCQVDGSADKIGLALAQKVQELMHTVQPGKIMHRPSTNNPSKDYYTVLYYSKYVGTTGLIIEHSFHTNPAACKWLMNDSNLQKLAVEEAKIIGEWFGVKKVLYRVRKTWEDAKSQLGAYSIVENAIKACKEGYGVYDADGNEIYANRPYTLELFVRDIQEACGVPVNGKADDATLKKTVTVSRAVNRTHAVVAPIQKRLYELGFTVVGEADGHAGPKFEQAVKEFQATGTGTVDGEITAGKLTWKRLLGLK